MDLVKLVKKSRDFEARRVIRLLKKSESEADKAKYQARLTLIKRIDPEALAVKTDKLDDTERRIMSRKDVVAALAARSKEPKEAKESKAKRTLPCAECQAMFATEEARAHHVMRRHSEAKNDDTSEDDGVEETLVRKKNRMGQRERKRRAMEEASSQNASQRPAKKPQNVPPALAVDKLHPSWQAAKRRQHAEAFQGKVETFAED